MGMGVAEKERSKPENRLSTTKNKLRFTGGEVSSGWVKWVTGGH